jgi:hypothetical protein
MSKIILKKSSVVDKVPLPGDLDYGELALNYADSKLFFKKSDNTIGTIGGGGAGGVGPSLQNRYSYTATAAQTTFLANYTAPYVDVYLNGLRLSSGVDYTATNGSSIVLTLSATVNDLVEIVATTTYTVQDSTKLPLSGGTMTGVIAFAAGQTFPGTQTTLVSGTSIKTINGTSVLGSGNIQIDGGVTSFNTRTGAVTLASSDVTTALGFTPVSQSAVNASISALVDSSPAALDTLNELAAALGDDPNFATTVTSNIASKLSLTGGTLTGASTVSVASWAKWTLETTGTTAKARQGSDANGLNFTSNALWNGSWTEDDSTKKKFAYIQHLGNGRHEFRTAASGTGISWVTSLTVDETAVNSLVALQQSGNQVLHAGNYTGYALPITGGTMTGAIAFVAGQTWPTFNQSTTGNAATATALQTARTINGVSFNGSANITVADSTKLPLAGGTLTGGLSGTTATFSGLIKADGGTIQVGSSAGVYRQLRYDGTISADGSTFNTLLHAGNYSSYSPTLTGGSASGTWGINVTGSAGSTSSTVGTTATAILSGYQAAINTTTPGTGNFGIHFNGQLTPDYASGITWNGGTSTTSAQAGIYVQGSGSYGTKMYLATTDSYATGARTAVSIDHSGNVNIVRGALQQAGNQVLHAGNYNSYSPTLTGTGASGTWGISISGTAANATNINSTQGLLGYAGSALNIDTGGQGGPQVQSQGSGAAMISFHRPGAYAINFGLGTDNQLRTGGWSRGGNHVILDSGNYTSYALARVSANRPGVTKLYRTDDDSGYNIQTHWSADVSGYWSLRGFLNDSYHAPAYVALSGRSNRANGNFYIDDNYGNTVVGVYTSTRYQGVYAMGDAYKMSADGASLANMYGIAWSHPNAGGAAGNLTDHGMLIINNGGFRCAISNSIVASGNITAYSDERLKTNWRDMPENFVARLAKVKVGIYDRIDTENGTQVGVSAQSFQELLPQAITTAKDDMKTLSVNYGGAALASAVELAKDNCELRVRIERLEALINSILNKN